MDWCRSLWLVHAAGERSAFRWAVTRMLEAGLLELVEAKPAPPIENDLLDLARLWPSNDPPQLFLRSTPPLWLRWRAELPILPSVSGPLPTAPIPAPTRKRPAAEANE